MTIVLINSTKAESVDGGNTAASAAADFTGANFFVMGCGALAGSTGHTAVDSQSNVWTPRTASDLSILSRIIDAKNATAGSSQTFGLSASSGVSYPSLTVAGFSGVHATSPFDQENGATGTLESISTGSVTPSEDNELIIAHIALTNTPTSLAIDNGFTIIQSQALSGGQSYASALAYKIQTTAAAINATWTWIGSLNVSARINTYKAAAAGGGGGKPWIHYATQMGS